MDQRPAGTQSLVVRVGQDGHESQALAHVLLPSAALGWASVRLGPAIFLRHDGAGREIRTAFGIPSHNGCAGPDRKGTGELMSVAVILR